jgi:hypothetical protein
MLVIPERSRRDLIVSDMKRGCSHGKSVKEVVNGQIVDV